jgi:hypothetical protein
MNTHSHDFEDGSWPFQDPENVTALTTIHVLERQFPVLLVTHDEDDGTWQILCGTTNNPKEGRIVCLGCLVRRDPSLKALADLPLGWTAWRDSLTAPWQRERNTRHSDDEIGGSDV